ncbi:MAG: alpha/beta hydrolase [Acidimicrobiia bacterium]|nr:alpha/beta hydrolase [Acidimicrobiia bacterium]
MTLAILVAIAGLVLFVVVTDQRIEAVESVDHATIDLEEPATVGNLTVNVTVSGGGPIPVVFLHDVDVAGGAVFEGAMAELPNRFHGVVVDLPGFGLSQRITGPDDTYAVAGMADVVAGVLEDRLSISAVIVGVGYGGEVASEIAVTRPDLVRGLVLVDVDFWEQPDWLEIAKGLPILGRSITFTFDAGGLLGTDRWSPNCDSGGWCPSDAQLSARSIAASIEGSTDALLGHLETLPSSRVPSALSEIVVPVSYVWSAKGSVPRETIDRLRAAIAELLLVESDSWMAHVDDPSAIAGAVDAVSP